jgi:hypothetical protein
MAPASANRSPTLRRHAGRISAKACRNAFPPKLRQLTNRANAHGLECGDRRRWNAQRRNGKRIKMLLLAARGHREDALADTGGKMALGPSRRARSMPRGSDRHADRGRRCHAHTKSLRMKRLHDASEKRLLGPVLLAEQPLATSQVANKARALKRCILKRGNRT